MKLQKKLLNKYMWPHYFKDERPIIYHTWFIGYIYIYVWEQSDIHLLHNVK